MFKTNDIIQFPQGPELFDIGAIVVGIAIFLLFVWFKGYYKQSPEFVKAVVYTFASYAASQFLVEHAEAQGMLMFLAAAIAWEARRLQEWTIVKYTVGAKALIALSLFFWPV